MDLSRYDFACQRAFSQGLSIAKTLGHQVLEVEHVALAFLRAETAPVEARIGERLKRRQASPETRHGLPDLGEETRLGHATPSAAASAATACASRVLPEPVGPMIAVVVPG